MLFTASSSPKEIWSVITKQLHQAATDPKHPFRFVNLCTLDGKQPDCRYVVLRQLNKDLQMICYTDSRTEKVAQINKNPDVCLVLYHQEERCQVKIKGKARVACDNEESEKHWKNVQPKAQGAYQSLLAPKTPIQKPNQGWKQDSEKQSRFFSVLFIIPEQVECLQLSGGNHLRIAFEKGKEDWIPTWLVP